MYLNKIKCNKRQRQTNKLLIQLAKILAKRCFKYFKHIHTYVLFLRLFSWMPLNKKKIDKFMCIYLLYSVFLNWNKITVKIITLLVLILLFSVQYSLVHREFLFFRWVLIEAWWCVNLWKKSTLFFLISLIFLFEELSNDYYHIMSYNLCFCIMCNLIHSFQFEVSIRVNGSLEKVDSKNLQLWIVEWIKKMHAWLYMILFNVLNKVHGSSR